MKNYLIKIFSVIAVIFISFFINKLNVKAEYKTKIVCEYEMLRVLSPNIGELDLSASQQVSYILVVIAIIVLVFKALNLPLLMIVDFTNI